ncbi:fibroblast growth factor receptor 4-like [Ptychodera flava]|uniref:fibroblast growth factor receptor 4-like n=1 Tax=Ptychodera flava TaxID=63121 RepID=UPI00396A560F
MEKQNSPEIVMFDNVTYAIEGREFIIVCQVSGNPTPDVQWKYNGNQVSQTETLQYEIIQRHQSGEYTCEANNTFWNNETAMEDLAFYLNVQYPPSINVAQWHVRKEYESVIFTCDVIDANPMNTMFTWLSFDGQMTTGAELNLPNVKRDRTGEYVCFGNNTYHNGEKGTGSNTTYFDVQYGPEVTVHESNIKIKEGAGLTLTCEVDSNPPVDSHCWIKNGLTISSTLSYSVEVVNRNDTGVYNCTAETTFYNDDVNIGHDTTQVVVEYLSVVDVLGPSDAVEEGKDQVTVTCTVTDGVPDPNSITLFHVNESVNLVDNVDDKDGVTIHTFDLGVVHRWINGSYYCIANTTFADQSVDSGISTKIPIIVHYKPSISDEDKEIMDVIIGSSVSLNCTVDAYPDANITWKKDGENLDFGEDSSIYNITFVVENDGGKYICIAENYLGTDQREIQLNVILSGGSSVAVPVVSTLFVIMVLAVLAVVFVAVWRKRKRKLLRERRLQEEADHPYQEIDLKDIPQLEGENDPQYQELDLRDIPQASVHPNLEQNASLSNTKSDTNTEYAMPGEIVLEFPKEYVRQKDFIGEGTFGRVFKAEAWELCDRDGVTVVALKTTKDNAPEDDKQKLTGELELLKTIGRHKNILSLVGYCTKTEPTYLLLDYMALGNLQKYLRDFRKSNADNYTNAEGKSPSLSSSDLISFAGQIASAMVYLSSEKVIHGDLAARNVMLNDDRICKVTNFGRDLDNLRGNADDNETQLPVRWMAPEVLWSSEFSIEGDVWSFGVVVWEIVTLGNTPYPGMSAKEVIEYLKKGSRMVRPKYCNEDLYLLMMKCWSQKPTRRPKFNDLVHELEEMEGDTEDYVDMKGGIDDAQEDVETTVETNSSEVSDTMLQSQ